MHFKLVLLKICILHFCIILLLPISNAQILVPLDENEWLNNLNRMRAAEPASDMQELIWDLDLQDVAEETAASCNYLPEDNHDTEIHVTNPDFYRTLRTIRHVHDKDSSPLNTQLIIYDWFDQIFDYDFETQSCFPKRNCQGFTTLSSALSCGVSCAMAQCSTPLERSKFPQSASTFLTVCVFGSMESQNVTRMRPYTIGSACKLCNSCTKNKLCVSTCQKKIKEKEIATTTTAPAQVSTLNCSDYHQLCQFWASENECELKPEFMQQSCPGSCNKRCSSPKLDTATTCSDNYHSLCTLWKKLNFCDSAMWAHFMQYHCSLTCHKECNEVKLILEDILESTEYITDSEGSGDKSNEESSDEDSSGRTFSDEWIEITPIVKDGSKNKDNIILTFDDYSTWPDKSAA